MRPGTKQRYFALILALFFSLLSQARAQEEVLLPEAAEDETAAVLQDTQLKIAYFHFFIEDYLGAATHLRLLEDTVKVPHNAEMLNKSRLLLGSLYLAWAMDRPATRVFNELVDVFPPGQARNDLLLIVARMQYERGLYETALETFRLLDAAQDFPQMDEAVYLAGMSRYALGNIKEAVVQFKRIAPESLYFPYAQLSLAQSYFLLEDMPKTLDHFGAVSRYDSGENALLKSFQEKSRLIWGQFLIEAGRYAQARSVLLQIPQESRFFPDALFARAWAEFKEKHYFKAILIFEDLITFYPEHPYALEALTAVGHAYNRLKVYQTALDRYAEAIDLYAEEEKRLREFESALSDPEQLKALLESYHDDTTQAGLLTALLKEDDAVRYWVEQYAELSKLSFFLDQKLRDMAVFEVMVDHREAVFRDFEPKVDRSLALDPVAVLRKKSDALNARIQRAISEEALSALASPEEAAVLGTLSGSRARRAAITLEMQGLEGEQADMAQRAEIAALKQDWEKVTRWFRIVEGELHWKIRTELPGRADDRQEDLRRANADLSRMAAAHAQLVLSVPTLSREIDGFRARIAAAQAQLAEKREKTRRLQVATLPALKAKLLTASERRLKRLMDFAATAELSRIQIFDIKAEATQP